MHKLLDIICDELDDLERKASESKLTVQDIEYGDMLAHFKKNLLTADAMMEAEEYSYNSYDDGMSMARGRGRNARRDSMGRYSRRSGGSYRGNSRDGYSRENYSRENYSRDDARMDMLNELREMQMDATDEETKQMIKTWMNQLEQR